MLQLKMYWLKGTQTDDIQLPEGYSFSTYKEDADKAAWVECCKNGLLCDGADESAFESTIKNHAFVVPETDLFFLDYNGEHIGTITAVYHGDENIGEVHMVGLKPEFRGKGLGKYLNNIAIKKLDAQGVKYIYLTTDEWRKGAVKSYISSGFLPVEYGMGMTSRWEAVMTNYGIDTLNMVDENGEFFKVLHKRGWDKDERKIRIGVFGAGRGKSMIDYCKIAGNAKLVAVCDAYQPTLDSLKEELGDEVAYYSEFDEFVRHDMDAVVLANFANQHAPFAIRCMENGLDVISEVLPVQTMKEAVELIECVERTGRLYAYAENYSFMAAPREMKKIYESGRLGEFEYGEGEYMHNCEPIWDDCTRGDPEHWRNTMYATYYCTHSIGPLIHITGLRPVSVTAFEMPFNARMKRMGAKAGNAAVEMITLENGAIIKSAHGIGCSKNSVWYSIYGSKGAAESAREITRNNGVGHLYYEIDEYDYTFVDAPYESFDGELKDELSETAESFGHGGSDYYVMSFFAQRLLGDPTADVIEVYEALDYFLPGILGYRSILNGGVPVEIPNLRDKSQRERFRNDTACTDKAVAGDRLIPSYSKGNPEIPQENYDKIRRQFEEKHGR